MKTLILLSLILALAFGVTFPCIDTGSGININGQGATNSNVTVTVGTTTGVARWSTPSVNNSYQLTVGGWNSTNGTLVELVCTVQTQQLILSNSQSGVIKGNELSALSSVTQYVFAQKDDANSNFRILVTSNTTSNTSVDLSFSLRQRGYNNFTNSTNATCDSICGVGLGVAFYTSNGTVNIDQFICWGAKTLVTGALFLMALVF